MDWTQHNADLTRAMLDIRRLLADPDNDILTLWHFEGEGWTCSISGAVLGQLTLDGKWEVCGTGATPLGAAVSLRDELLELTGAPA